MQIVREAKISEKTTNEILCLSIGGTEKRFCLQHTVARETVSILKNYRHTKALKKHARKSAGRILVLGLQMNLLQREISSLYRKLKI